MQRNVRKFKLSELNKTFIRGRVLNGAHNTAIKEIKMESSEIIASFKSNSVCIFV